MERRESRTDFGPLLIDVFPLFLVYCRHYQRGRRVVRWTKSLAGIGDRVKFRRISVSYPTNHDWYFGFRPVTKQSYPFVET